MDRFITGEVGGAGLLLDPSELSAKPGYDVPLPDLARLRGYRLERVRDQLRRRDLAGCLLFDPVNIRYATDSRNMAVWTLHYRCRYCFIATDGPVVLFDFHRCDHLSDGLEGVDEVRPATSFLYFLAGDRADERVKRFAMEIADLVQAHGGGNRRIAVDSIDPMAADALIAAGVDVIDGQEPLDQARLIKSEDEIRCMRAAIAVAEEGLARLSVAAEAGVTENALWSVLHQVNIARGGEWIATRLLTSGQRTNPWYQECSDRVIGKGELVALDTDMVGPYGYWADLSRTFHTGPQLPTDEQRRLYRLAYEQVQTNMALLKPGLGFREFAEKAWTIPASCLANRYTCILHGVGVADEYPVIVDKDDFDEWGYDGVFESGMAICVESYIGEDGGAEGIKLEEQVLITDNGVELLSSFPFDDRLLPREI
jgi:Xaa-Pro aminopeptidase